MALLRWSFIAKFHFFHASQNHSKCLFTQGFQYGWKSKTTCFTIEKAKQSIGLQASQ